MTRTWHGTQQRNCGSRQGSCPRVSPWRRDLRIRYETSQMSDSAVVNTAEAIMRRLLQQQLEQPAADHEETPAVATGLRKVYYLVMASGSFTLTIVGFLVPGVPTVPFLMATSYYLVRSSPRLNEKLLRLDSSGQSLKTCSLLAACVPGTRPS